MSVRPAGTLKVLGLLAKVNFRRMVNRFGGAFRAFYRKKRKVKTTARPGRFALRLFAVVIVGVLFSFQALQLSSMVIGGVSASVMAGAVDAEGRLIISSDTYAAISQADSVLSDLRTKFERADSADTKEATALDIDDANSDLDAALYVEAERRLFPSTFDSFGRRVGPSDHSPQEEADIAAERDRLRAIFDRAGRDGFAAGRRRVFPWPGPNLWVSGPRAPVMSSAFAIMLLLVFLSLVAGNLGMANRDLGKAEWDMVWLFTFPVPPKSLFLARLLDYAIVNPMAWFVNFFLIFTALYSSGLLWTAIPVALVCAACLNLIIASVVVLAEVFLRRYLSLRRAKTIQSVATVLSMLAFFGVMGAGFSPTIAAYLVRAASYLGASVMWLPSSLPALLTLGGFASIVAISLLVILAVALPWASATAAAALVAPGLLRETNVYTGAKTATTPARSRSPFTGIIGKDLRLLMRDRALMTRVLILPILFAAFQLIINPRLLAAGASSPTKAVALVFGLAAFVLVSGGLTALVHESKPLWLLYTFPQSLAKILAQKALLWWGIATIYASLFLTGVYFKTSFEMAVFLPSALFCLAGILPFSFIAVALGAMGTDPAATDEQTRISMWMVYLCMILAGLYMPVIFVDALSLRLPLFAAYCLVAFLVWSMAASRLPRLLDQS